MSAVATVALQAGLNGFLQSGLRSTRHALVPHTTLSPAAQCPCKEKFCIVQVMFKMHVIHVNESAIVPDAWRHHMDEHAERVAHVLQTKFSPDSMTHARLEDVFDVEGHTATRAGRLRQLLTSISDTTLRQDMLALLRLELLHSLARQQGCNKLVVGECATRLAGNFIAAAAKVLCSEITFCALAALSMPASMTHARLLTFCALAHGLLRT
jgi:hypothetical protein